jgi:hypothetical protein
MIVDNKTGGLLDFSLLISGDGSDDGFDLAMIFYDRTEE